MFLWSFIHWFNVCDIYFYYFLHHIMYHDAHLFFRSWLSFFSFERKCCHYLHLSNSTGLRNFHFCFISFRFLKIKTWCTEYHLNWVEPVRQERENFFLSFVWAPFKKRYFQTSNSTVWGSILLIVIFAFFLFFLFKV